MAATLPNAGIAAPLPDDFDFAARLVMPPQKDPTSRSVRVRTAHNRKAERHNEESMDQTLDCRDDRANHPDVGPALMAMYPYTVDEIETMVASDSYCDQIGPLPVFLRKLVVDTRLKDATKSGQKGKADGEKAKARPLRGAMVHASPIRRIPGERPDVIISDVVLHSILAKQYLPLTWFTHERLELAQYNIHELHTRLFRPEPTSAGTTSDIKVEIFDMAKMTALWGTDADYHSLSPFQWHEAMTNYHAALVKLSPALPPVTDPSLPQTTFSFAVEFDSHRQFFARYPNFEETYPLWYSFERESRNDILKGVLFDRMHYVMEVGSILGALKAVETAASLHAPLPLAKRSSDSDMGGAAKAPRTVNDSPGSFEATQ